MFDFRFNPDLEKLKIHFGIDKSHSTEGTSLLRHVTELPIDSSNAILEFKIIKYNKHAKELLMSWTKSTATWMKEEFIPYFLDTIKQKDIIGSLSDETYIPVMNETDINKLIEKGSFFFLYHPYENYNAFYMITSRSHLPNFTTHIYLNYNQARNIPYYYWKPHRRYWQPHKRSIKTLNYSSLVARLQVSQIHPVFEENKWHHIYDPGWHI